MLLHPSHGWQALRSAAPSSQILRKSADWRIFLLQEADEQNKKDGNNEIKDEGLGKQELG